MKDALAVVMLFFLFMFTIPYLLHSCEHNKHPTPPQKGGRDEQ